MTLEATMKIEMQALNLELTRALRDHLKRRMKFAFGTHRQHIQSILVRLSDINGPRGGEDKCCHIHVVLPQMANIVVKDTESNIRAAIDRAAQRASRTVARRIARLRNKGRSQMSANRRRHQDSVDDMVLSGY
jgi:ribosomal subunit interface protein